MTISASLLRSSVNSYLFSPLVHASLLKNQPLDPGPATEQSQQASGGLSLKQLLISEPAKARLIIFSKKPVMRTTPR